MTVEEIARACHEVNRTYQMFQDAGYISLPWSEAPEWQKWSAVLGVRMVLECPKTTAEQNHEHWIQHKEEQGWRYGPILDSDKRTHPCLMSYDNLPESQKAKDNIFMAVINGLKGELDVGT